MSVLAHAHTPQNEIHLPQASGLLICVHIKAQSMGVHVYKAEN